MDSGDSHATSCVSTSEEEREVDRQEVESESSREEEITEEPMEEEDTKLVGSAMTRHHFMQCRTLQSRGQAA